MSCFLRSLAGIFLMRFGGHRHAVIENVLTTVVLLFIAIVGWFRGPGGLDKIEEAAVAIKLAIIAALLIGLFGFDWHWLASNQTFIEPNEYLTRIERIRLLAGLLLIVQGFETSRYLGNAYDPAMRVRSMQLAQLIAGGIYLLFVIEVLAALMSQVSAAVADTEGTGGLFTELSGSRLSSRLGHIGLVTLAILLVCTGNVFDIVTLTSRVFAAYYLLQCLVAIAVTFRAIWLTGLQRVVLLMLFSGVVMMLALIVVYAIPVG